MDKQIFILGTSHEYQRNDNTCHQKSIIDFKQYLKDICKLYAIKGIGEEMSEEALSDFDREISVPKLITLESNNVIKHKYCDPEKGEQLALGIKPSGYFCQGRKIPEIVRPPEVKGLSQEEADQLEWEEDLKREPIWFERLLEFNTWPVLFVCGSKHVDSFKKLIEKQNINVFVVHENWKHDE